MKITVWARAFDTTCGGKIALHKLARLLREHGYDARLSASLDPGASNPWGIPYSDETPDVAIYPEVIEGNPLNGKIVVRWLLHRPGVMSGITTFAPDEITVSYAPYFSEGYVAEPLFVVETWPQHLFDDGNRERQPVCHTRRKAKTGSVDEFGPDIGRGAIEHIGAVLRGYNRFVSLDHVSFLSVAAVLCGCQSIVIPQPGLSADEWRRGQPLLSKGIAYGFSDEELDHAKRTAPDVRQLMDDIEAESHRQVERLMERVRDY